MKSQNGKKKSEKTKKYEIKKRNKSQNCKEKSKKKEKKEKKKPGSVITSKTCSEAKSCTTDGFLVFKFFKSKASKFEDI